MPAQNIFEYALVRVVPRVDREEFMNVGVILYCAAEQFLEARIELDPVRLAALDPTVDAVMVQRSLETLPRICAGGPDAGPIGCLTQRERFEWLASPRSTIIQTSPIHTGICVAPRTAMDNLIKTMVHRPGNE